MSSDFRANYLVINAVIFLFFFFTEQCDDVAVYIVPMEQSTEKIYAQVPKIPNLK